MAHLWIPDDVATWAILVLDVCAYDLDRTPPARIPAAQVAPDGVPLERQRQVWLVPAGEPPSTRWALLAGPHRRAWVNGSRLDLGLRLLDDRDHIRLDNGKIYLFSAEAPAHRERYTGEGRVVQCPRCKEEISPGTMAVRCPICSVWHHETDNRPCWTDYPTCSRCDHESRLDEVQCRWVPEEV